MKFKDTSPLKFVTATAMLALLSACGGGGGGAPPASTPAPPPVTTPAPTPSPSPTPPPPNTPPTPPTVSLFDTSEFRMSDGPDQHGAITAWEDGATGQGQTIAIIDTGIDQDSPEFAGRIHADSQDVAGNRGFDAEDDHGTNVALIAAGGRNDTGVLGIAFNSELLVLRADSPGSCGADTPENTDLGCSFFDRDIARGIDQAVTSGARVVNISLGGGGASQSVLDAVGRAADAGVVILVAAGNGGDGSEAGVDPNQPNVFASQIRQAGNGNVIIVGSHDENRAFSDFSQQAGDEADSFLTARGERVCCVYEDGEVFIGQDAQGAFRLVFSGTSFATPQVAGAVALLAQQFPNLTGQEIVSILLDSAQDAGASGTDTTFGRGILDIAAAFAPAGTTTLAGSTSVLRVGASTGIGSAAMGDALSGATGVQGIVLDKYDRAFQLDIAAGLRGAQIQPRLQNALSTQTRRVALQDDGVSLAFSISDVGTQADTVWTRQLQLTPEQVDGARVLAARLAARISPNTQVGFALRESAHGLAGQLQGASRPAFLIARDASGDTGFSRNSDAAFALRRQIAGFGLTATAEAGEIWLGNDRRELELLSNVREQYPFQSFTLAADRRIGPIETIFGVSLLQEDRTVLGGFFHESLGVNGADTLFLDAQAGLALATNWRLGASWRQGYTRPDKSGLVVDGSQFQSNAWSMDLARYNLLKQGDTLGLRVSRPLRVSSGGLNLNLPVAFDNFTETAQFDTRRISLAPTGRELISEMSWRGPLWAGQASASVYYRTEPGHYKQAPNDAGFALSWSRGF